MLGMVHKRDIYEGIARYIYTKRLLQDFFEEDSARVWVAKRRALRDVWLG